MAHCLKHKGNYSDDFWMLSFKVVPCTKTYAHSWSSCPCAHPGETARRRDPTLFNYQPVLCPNVKSKSGCPAGDSCGYAHNVFEQWLHPQRYKALMCTYGSQCTRPSCFFAHSLEELRVPWKGGNGGGGSGGEQSQQQPYLQHQLQQQAHGTGPNSGAGEGDGTIGDFSAMGLSIGGGNGGGSTAGGDSDASAVNASLPNHAAAAAAAAAGVVVGAAGGHGGGSGRPRLVMQAASGSLQQQLQQLQQQASTGGGLLPPGGGTHSVVDVRVVAGARAMPAAPPPFPLWGGGGAGLGLSSDHGASLSAPYPQQTSQNIRRGGVLLGGAGSSGPALLQQRVSVGTGSVSAPYDLDTATSVPVDSTSLPLVAGAPAHGQLYRTNSNGSTLYGGLTEEAPLAVGQSSGGPGAAPSGQTMGGVPGVVGIDGISESASTTSLYQTPPSASQHQLSVPGLASMGVYVGGNAAAGGGCSAEIADAGGAGAALGPVMPGGRPLPLGAPQLQQHLQQLHQHQQQMQLQQAHQLQHQQQQQPHRVGGGGGGTTGQTATGPSAQPSLSLPTVVSAGRSRQGQQQGPILKEIVGLAGGGGAGASGSVGWLTQAQQPLHHQQSNSGIEFGPTAGGGTASLDLTGAPNNSTSVGMQSSNIYDMTEDMEQSGGLSSWGPITTAGREGVSGTFASYGQLQHQQLHQQAKQGVALGLASPLNTSSSTGNQRPGVTRGHSAVLPEDTAAVAVSAHHAAVEHVRQQVQQLHMVGTGPQLPAQQQAGGQDAAAAAAAAAAAVGILGGPRGDTSGPEQVAFTDVGRSGFRRQISLHPVSTSAQSLADLVGFNAASNSTTAATALIDPEVEMLLLSSLQLQLSHAGVAAHPVVASFSVRNWLRQAVQGRAQTATRSYLLDLLTSYMPPDQLTVIRRLLDCLDEAGVLLSCFAGPGSSAATFAAATTAALPGVAVGSGGSAAVPSAGSTAPGARVGRG